MGGGEPLPDDLGSVRCPLAAQWQAGRSDGRGIGVGVHRGLRWGGRRAVAARGGSCDVVAGEKGTERAWPLMEARPEARFAQGLSVRGGDGGGAACAGRGLVAADGVGASGVDAARPGG